MNLIKPATLLSCSQIRADTLCLLSTNLRPSVLFELRIPRPPSVPLDPEALPVDNRQPALLLHPPHACTHERREHAHDVVRPRRHLERDHRGREARREAVDGVPVERERGGRLRLEVVRPAPRAVEGPKGQRGDLPPARDLEGDGVRAADAEGAVGRLRQDANEWLRCCGCSCDSPA